MNKVPYIISALVRVYSKDDETWESHNIQKRIVMAYTEEDAKEKYIEYMKKKIHHPTHKVKCYNMEIEEPIL